MFCNYCGAQNPGDARFCSACGKAIAAAVQSPHVSQPPQVPQATRAPQAAPATQAPAVWDRLILPAELKRQLQNTCQLLRQAAQNQVPGLRPPNILLCGPPGTGKTEIARTLAAEPNVGFVMATPADLKAGFIGQSATLVRNVFEKARAMAPAILFIDEIETVAAERSSPLCDSLTREVAAELLTQMDGAQRDPRTVMIVAATNFPDQIDAAVLNRFIKIEIPLPDEAARGTLLKQLIRSCGWPLDPALDVDEVAAMLAKKTQMSGRDLRLRVSRAVQQALLTSASPGGSAADSRKLARRVRGPRAESAISRAVFRDRAWSGEVRRRWRSALCLHRLAGATSRSTGRGWQAVRCGGHFRRFGRAPARKCNRRVGWSKGDERSKW